MSGIFQSFPARRHMAPPLLTMALLTACAGTGRPAETPAGPGLEVIQELEGTWVRCDESGSPTEVVTNVFRITAGGSAVSEVVFPGAPEEMLTVYVAGKDGLELTHYCAARNAPRMVLDPTSTLDDLRFTCTGGVGLENHSTGHMHTGRLVRLGPNRMRTEWAYHENGEITFTGVFDIARVERP
jgi:hypothetical protein